MNTDLLLFIVQQESLELRLRSKIQEKRHLERRCFQIIQHLSMVFDPRR